MTTQSKIVIIGSGFSGIGMAIALRKAGFRDFVSWKKPLTWAAREPAHRDL